MMASKRKFRLRWRRMATILIGAYLVYWSGVSVHHIFAIRHDEQSLNHKIAVIRTRNHVLTMDLQLLNNSAKLKRILSGQMPLPNPNGTP